MPKLTLVPKDKTKPSKKILQKMYIKEEKTQREIAEEFGTSDVTVGKWLKQDNIETRDFRALYDLKTNRKKTVDEILNISAKNPSQLNTSDLCKKNNGKSSKGVLNWYKREYNCKDKKALEILVEDLYSISLPESPTLGKKSYRKDLMDTLLRTLKKRPEELTTPDFSRVKKGDGTSYVGILQWYKRRYSCKPREAINRLIEDLYEKNKITKKSKWGIYNNRIYRKDCTDRILKALDKNPVQLSTSDFNRVKQQDGCSHVGLLQWYGRKNKCTLKEALNILLEELYNVKVSIKSDEQLESFLQETPEAQELGNLALVSNNNVSDIASIFTQLWPDRFPSVAELARALPKAVARVGHALVPFTLEKAKDFRERIRGLPDEVQYSLDDMLFSVVVGQYQISFNKKPEHTLGEIRHFVRENRNNGIKDLASKVLGYYEEIYSFNIPGFGTLKDYNNQ